jgi:hypothetical protein
MNLLRWFGLFGVLSVTVIFRMPARGDQSITLAWNPDTETNISNYNLYYGGTSGVYTNSANVGNATNCTVAGLQSAVTYYFAVTADNTSGLESPPSNEISYTVPTLVVSTSPGLPVLATMAAGSVTSASATLNGLVNPDGAATSASFEYGTNTSYGANTPGVNLGTGVNSLAVNSSISGLLPGTSYHFNLVAANAVGKATGADATFATPAIAPRVITQSAGGITSSNATFNGAVDPDGASTTAYFEYGASTSYGATTPVMNLGAGTSALAVSAAISGLVPVTTYHFHLVAASVAGTTAGADAIFATPAAAPVTVIQPSPPSVITQPASGIASSQATLNGSVDPNGVSTTAYFEYGLSTGYGAAAPVINLGAGTNSMAASAVISSLLPRTTYHFHLVALSAAGKTAGADASFTTTSRHGNH